jgi:hypothetical protein
MTVSVFSIVLNDAHEHVWKRIDQVADMVVRDRCTVAGCGAKHYYDPHVEPPRRYELVSARSGDTKGRGAQ